MQYQKMNKRCKAYLYFHKILKRFLKKPRLANSNFKDLFETVVNMVMEQPKDTAKLIRTWVHEADGKEKAAIFLIALDSDISVKDVFTYISEDEIESIIYFIAINNVVSVEQKYDVLYEFVKRMAKKQFVFHNFSL